MLRLDSVRRAAYRQLVGWWLASRALVFACAAIVQVVGWPRPHWHPSLFHHPFAVLSVWDGRWYRTIAERGYLLVPGRQSDPAFFPLLSVIERGLAGIGIAPETSGIVIANLAFPVGLFVLYELTRHVLPEPDARRTASYLAFFPLSYVFSMAYPEALVLPLFAGAGLAALRGRWGIAAVCASLATFGRPEGLFLALPLGVLAARRWPTLPPRQRSSAVAAVLAAPATLALFSLYIWRTLGDPLAWSKAEAQWGRSFSATGVFKAFTQLAHAVGHHNAWLYRDAAFCLVYVALLIVALRAGVSRSWLLASTAIVLLPLASGTFTSDARFGLLAIAAFWGLAVAGRNRIVHRVVWALSPVLLATAVLTIPLRFP